MSTLEEAEAFFDDEPVGTGAVRWVASVLAGCGAVGVDVSRSQVAFRRTAASGERAGARTVALLWRPGQYLAAPRAPVVLSIPLAAHDASPRWKEVAHPSRSTWMHHLEVTTVLDLDDEVEAWLRQSYRR